MSPRDLATWSAVYGAAWCTAASPIALGVVTDRERAVIAAVIADRAVEALRQARPEEPE